MKAWGFNPATGLIFILTIGYFVSLVLRVCFNPATGLIFILTRLFEREATVLFVSIPRLG